MLSWTILKDLPNYKNGFIVNLNLGCILNNPNIYVYNTYIWTFKHIYNSHKNIHNTHISILKYYSKRKLPNHFKIAISEFILFSLSFILFFSLYLNVVLDSFREEIFRQYYLYKFLSFVRKCKENPQKKLWKIGNIWIGALSSHYQNKIKGKKIIKL